MTIPWPIHEPVPVRDMSLELLVRKLLRQKAPVSAEQYAAAVQRIHSWFDEAGPVRKRVQRFLDVITTIDEIKQRVMDRDSVSFVSNMLAVSLGRLYAVRLPMDKAYLSELQRLVRSLERSRDYGWLYPKMMAFEQAYILHNYAVRQVRQDMPTDDEAARQLAQLGVKDGETAIAEIAAALAGHRAYGVKPCLFADGIHHSDEDAWVFSDGFDFLRQARIAGYSAPAQPLAVVALAARRDIDVLKPRKTERHLVGSSYSGVLFGFPYKMLFAIHASGEFTEDVEIGAASLRECFMRAERTVAYTLFRMVQLSRLYNLIVPQYVRRGLEVPDWPVMPKGRQERQAHRRQLQAGGLRELVLPRLRVLRDPAAVQAALQRELIQAAAETSRRDRQPIARHDVTGFVRKLPPGCVATEQARKQALSERGIVLTDGETYVRAHQRGQGANAAPGHIAKLRK